jgi:predicted membrane protein
MHETPRTHGNILLGLILIALGIIFIFSKFIPFDFFDFIFDWWPLILVLIGLKKMMSPGEPRFGGGFIIFIIGTFFLLINLNILRWSYLTYLWPVVLILIGLRFIFPSRHKPFTSSSESSKDKVDTVAIFGGTDLVVSSQDFHGGQATALFGGVDIDMHAAKLHAQGATLHASALFGGVEIRVPRDWSVKVEGTPIFGSLENKCASPESVNAPQLLIKGSAIFGGVEVKN